MTAALRGQHPADIAEAFRELARPEALAVFNWLDNARAAEVLDDIDPELVRYILDNAPPERIAELLDRLPMDEAAEVISEADPDMAEILLEDLTERAPEDAAEVRELLSYPESSAGRLMTDKFVRLKSDMTVEQAWEAVRKADPEVETLTDLYVVEPMRSGGHADERLVGVLSLRDLVRAKGHQLIADVMTPEPITVQVDTDQEEVAKMFSKYDFLALPVLDHSGALAGIVTVDDVVDVLEEEHSEDVLALGAVTTAGDEAGYLTTSVSRTVRRRVWWLLMLFLASTLTGAVITHFEDELARVVALSIFIPLLIGTGGNAGSQTVTTVIRALAVGEVRLKDWLRVLFRELRTGLALGLLLAVVGFVFVNVGWHKEAEIAVVVSLSLVAIVTWATIVGSLLPLAASRLGFDPAVMSAPFISTFVDATGLFLYFTIARMVLGI